MTKDDCIGRSLPEDRRENQVKFFGFSPQGSSFNLLVWLCGDDHSQPMFGCACFFLARSDLATEFLFRDSIIGFTIISADDRAGSEELVDEWIINRILRDRSGKLGGGFAETRRPFFQVKLWRSAPRIVVA